MTALQAAGSAMLQAGPSDMLSSGPSMAKPLGVRSLRNNLLKPGSRAAVTINLQMIEEQLRKHLEPEVPRSSEEREMPRFKHLFESGSLFPPILFIVALELGPCEVLNGQKLQFDAEVLTLRDNLAAAYKPILPKIQMMMSRELTSLPKKMVQNFSDAWIQWEGAWLRNREVHAVEALQPLAKAILALEPLLLSAEKERLLAWPRVQHQKAVTLRCLEGFVHTLAELAGSVLPSLARELDHDPRLLLLMDHVMTLRGEAGSVKSCLSGVSATPDVGFDIYHQPANSVNKVAEPTIPPPQGPGNLYNFGPSPTASKGMTLDDYAFKLLGLSSRMDTAGTKAAMAAKTGVTEFASRSASAPAGHEGSVVERRVGWHASEMLAAFEDVKDMLLSLKSTLDFIDPSLDNDKKFVACLHRLERAFRRSKRLFLEPDNLA
mmetsp:Transcript_11163/g.20287  ORF Transcript_11163/g.20287 Transcript_11163/m.20287 type:complete len:434 (-) Transcript_11163:71-1372(-)